MKPIDKLGFGPKRKSVRNPDGTYTIKITPPVFMGGREVEVPLTSTQYLGYLAWENGQLIQDALPDLSPSQRELILTGLDDAAFKAAFEDGDDEEKA